jgi:hypothetical protein
MSELTWKKEMEYLNDDQLKRIAFARDDSWGFQYIGERNCVLAHILDFKAASVVLHNYYHTLNLTYSPLEQYYSQAFSRDETDKIIHPEIIKEIQDHAKKLLEERAKKIERELEIQT